MKANDPYVPLAKIDCTQEKDLCAKYGVQGYPSLKFFINKEPIDYEGGRTEPEIIAWLKKKTGPSAYELATVDAVEKFKSQNEVSVVFFGTAGSKEHETFLAVSKKYDDLMFGFCFNAEAQTHFATHANSVVLFKNFDELRNNFEGSEFTNEKIAAFVEENRYKLISVFDDKSITRIFHQNQPGLCLFTDGSEASKKAEGELIKAAATLKGKIVLTLSGAKDGLGKRLADYIGVTEADVPTVKCR